MDSNQSIPFLEDGSDAARRVVIKTVDLDGWRGGHGILSVTVGRACAYGAQGFCSDAAL